MFWEVTVSNSIDLGCGVFIGGDNLCVVMLDAGVNHNNDPKRALELIKTAKQGGASAIKFQTYTAGEISTKTAPRYWDSKLDTDGGVSQYDMFKKVDKLPKEAYFEMKEYAKELKIAFSSSPFGMESAKFLKKLDIDFYKIASAEMINYQMIEFIADIGKPMIFSTGACSIDEVEKALDIAYKMGNTNVALQHCILSYPCKDEDANLAKMVKLQQLFPDIPIGYSDHTYGEVVPLAAVALGAKSIEKHYTLEQSLPNSPDHKFSLTRDELKNFTLNIKKVELSIGKYSEGYYPVEEKAYLYARKSIVAVEPIKKDTVITASMIDCKRPGTGVYPQFMNKFIGKKAKVDIAEDEILRWDMI